MFCQHCNFDLGEIEYNQIIECSNCGYNIIFENYLEGISIPIYSFVDSSQLEKDLESGESLKDFYITDEEILKLFTEARNES
jgi:hypothetical protein